MISSSRRRRRRLGLSVVLAGIVAACGVDVTGSDDSGVADGGGGESSLPPNNNDGGGGVDVRSDALDAADQDAAIPDDGSPCNSPRGPKMVDVGGYCIDATEVTQAQYAEFLNALSTGALDAGARDVCNWKTSYAPPTKGAGVDCYWQPDASPNVAVVCVDWCDADAFCRWSGKRLCGALDGGAAAVAWDGDDNVDPNKDAWFRACSKNGTLKYGYGATYVDKACNTAESGYGRAVDAGSQPACVGGYAGLVDMVGNVDEHEDGCKGTAGRADRCRYRGGSWYWSGNENACDHRYGAAEATREARFADVGFRCCSK